MNELRAVVGAIVEDIDEVEGEMEDVLKAVDVGTVTDGMIVEGSSKAVEVKALEDTDEAVVMVNVALVCGISEPSEEMTVLVLGPGRLVDGTELIDSEAVGGTYAEVGPSVGVLSILDVSIKELARLVPGVAELDDTNSEEEGTKAEVGDAQREVVASSDDKAAGEVVEVEVGARLGTVKDGEAGADPGLTIVTVEGLQFEQTVVSGSSSVTVTVVGVGSMVIVLVVPAVFTTVTCAEAAADAEEPAPPSTGTTEYVGLLPRASKS